MSTFELGVGHPTTNGGKSYDVEKTKVFYVFGISLGLFFGRFL